MNKPYVPDTPEWRLWLEAIGLALVHALWFPAAMIGFALLIFWAEPDCPPGTVWNLDVCRIVDRAKLKDYYWHKMHDPPTPTWYEALIDSLSKSMGIEPKHKGK